MAMNQDTGEFRELVDEKQKKALEKLFEDYTLEEPELGVVGTPEQIERLSKQIKKANQLEDDKCPSSD